MNNTSNKNYAHSQSQMYLQNFNGTGGNQAGSAGEQGLEPATTDCAQGLGQSIGFQQRQQMAANAGVNTNVQGNRSTASQDDGKIVDEIEKTIQGLLNLNIFESFSNSSDDHDSKNNVSEGGAADNANTAGTNDVSNSDGKLSAESQNKNSGNIKGSINDGGDGVSTAKALQAKQQEMRNQEKKEFVEECTKKIIQKIESENIQNMEQLGQILQICLQEFSQVYEGKFMNSGAIDARQQLEESSNSKLSNDNKLLKRAVKILYNRLSQTRHQQANTDTIIEQNRNLQRLLQVKDQQIVQMQQQMAHMRQMMMNIAQLQAQSEGDGRFDNFDHYFDQGGYGGGQGQGGNQGFHRDGDVF